MSLLTSLKEKSLQTLLNTFPCHLEDTIVLTGTARSGTTWLAEVLRTLPGYKYLNEPLNRKRNPGAVQAGLDWRPFLAPTESQPVAEGYMRRALTGRIAGDWHMPTTSTTGRLLNHATQRRLLVKFVRAGRMLQWISHRFEIRGIVFIVRHPCAVVSSMLEHGAWSSIDANSETLKNHLGGALPSPLEEEIRNRLSDLPRTPAEQLAFLWALDHYIPFHYFEQHGHPWTLVSYEAILQDGAGELERIFRALGNDVPQAAYNHLMEASNSASRDLQMQNAPRQLSKWTRKLDGDQIERILRIVESFDLCFYSSDVEPEYELLSQYQSTARP